MSISNETQHDESTVLCDAALLDSYYQHMPFDDDCTFVNDVPQDIVSVMPSAFPSWGMTTPPHSDSSSEDECFSPPPADLESTYVPGLLWDSQDADISSLWDTPPTSPPRSEEDFGLDTSAFNFDAPLLMDDPIATTPPLSPRKVSRPNPVTASRKPTSGATKSTKRPAVSSAAASAAVARMQAAAAVAASRTTKFPVHNMAPSHTTTTTMGPNGLIENPESKRRIHNVLERKRRNDLKLSYQSLRCQLPLLADNDRAPTGHILIQAVEYITDLKKEEVSLAQKTAMLREQIEMKRRRLVSMKSTHTVAALPMAISA